MPNISKYDSNHTTTKSAASVVFKFLLKTPVRGYLQDVRLNLSNICPYGEKDLDRKTEDIVFRAFLFGTVFGFIAFFFDLFVARTLSLYTFMSTAFTVWAVFNISVINSLRKIKDHINNDLNEYFTNCIYAYQNTGSIYQTLSESTLGLSPEINEINSEIIRIIESENAKEEINNFVSDPGRSPYIKLFATQCFNASTRGDAKKDELSLFCSNIEHLRSEFLVSQLRQKKRDYTYKGFNIIATIPVPILNVFAKWGVSFTSEMATFYANYGLLIQILCVLSSVFVLNILQKNNGLSRHNHTDVRNRKIAPLNFRFKNAERTKNKLDLTNSNISLAAYYTRCILFGVVGFLALIIITVYSNNTYKWETIISENVETISVGTQKELITDIIINLSSKYKDNDPNSLPEAVITQEIAAGGIINRYTRTAMIAEIKNRIIEYQSQSLLKWYQFLLCLLGSGLALVPIITLNLNYHFIKNSEVDEVQLFQTIILLEKDMENSTVFSILQEMDSYTRLWRREFDSAVMEYPNNPELSLAGLDTISNTDVKEIIAELKASDRVGLKAACANIETNILMTERTKNQELDIADENAKNLYSLLVTIPLGIAFIGYFVLPFIMTSIKDVGNIFEIMGGL